MTQQFLVLHLTDATGTALPQEEDRRMLESWAAEGEREGALGPGLTLRLRCRRAGCRA